MLEKWTGIKGKKFGINANYKKDAKFKCIIAKSNVECVCATTKDMGTIEVTKIDVQTIDKLTNKFLALQ